MDWGGGLVGVVVIGQLARIAPGDRARLRLDRVALAVPPAYLASPEDPAGPLLAHRPLGGEVMAVVLAGGHVAGIVTAGNLRQAAQGSGGRSDDERAGTADRGRR